MTRTEYEQLAQAMHAQAKLAVFEYLMETVRRQLHAQKDPEERDRRLAVFAADLGVFERRFARALLRGGAAQLTFPALHPAEADLAASLFREALGDVASQVKARVRQAPLGKARFDGTSIRAG